MQVESGQALDVSSTQASNSSSTKDYQYEIDPNALWIESRHTSDEKDFVPCTELYEDYKSWAEENQIGLSVDFDAKSFGRSVMRK